MQVGLYTFTHFFMSVKMQIPLRYTDTLVDVLSCNNDIKLSYNGDIKLAHNSLWSLVEGKLVKVFSNDTCVGI